MSTDRPEPPEPLLAAIREEAARVRQEGLAADLDDPALQELVERAVATYEPVLTPEGLEEARRVATLALATHPDIEGVLARRGWRRLRGDGGGGRDEPDARGARGASPLGDADRGGVREVL